MLAEQRMKEGDLEGALADLTDRVKKAPNDAKLRVFLFQLLSVLGQWDRAAKQLEVTADLDPETIAMVQAYRDVLRCEALRAEVFAGKRTPIFFGEPEEWMAYLLTALELLAKGEIGGAKAARDQAFELAPATRGKIDGQPFEWIADADPRLGPMLEAYMNGRYQWIPFARLKEIRLEPPEDLRDLVWAPAYLTLATGATTVAFIPTRYPGSERAGDAALRLAKRTDFEDRGEETFIGLGQRLLATDAGEHPLLDVRLIELDTELG